MPAATSLVLRERLRKSSPPTANRPRAAPRSAPRAAETLGGFTSRYEIPYRRLKPDRSDYWSKALVRHGLMRGRRSRRCWGSLPGKFW